MGRSSWNTLVSAPKGKRSKAAPNSRLTTAKAPAISDFFACSFSSKARHRIRPTSSAANRSVTLDDT